MNAKRILPWKEADEHFYRAHVCMIAETSIGAYAIIDRGKYVNKFAWMLEEVEWEYSKVYRYVDTIDAAIDACEADYVARCTEFLTLYDPATHVVVSREMAKTALVMLSGSGDVLSFDRDDAETELRAALEVGK
jgi:hypothetical protein